MGATGTHPPHRRDEKQITDAMQCAYYGRNDRQVHTARAERKARTAGATTDKYTPRGRNARRISRWTREMTADAALINMPRGAINFNN